MSFAARHKVLLSGLAAFVVAIPAGFAIAHEGEGEVYGPEAMTPASECSAEVNQPWEDIGAPRDAYAGGCPTAEYSANAAAEYKEQRSSGLEKIAAGIREYGDSPEDEEQLETVESELDTLNGEGD